MNLNALWSLEYATNHGDFGAGVAVLVAGHIFGGDNQYCYEGHYQLEDNELQGRLVLRPHHRQLMPACALDATLCILFSGKLGLNGLELTGIMEHDSTTKLFIHLSRQSDLPEIISSAHEYHSRAEAVAAMVSPYVINLQHQMLGGDLLN